MVGMPHLWVIRSEGVYKWGEIKVVPRYVTVAKRCGCYQNHSYWRRFKLVAKKWNNPQFTLEIKAITLVLLQIADMHVAAHAW
jgi:hypothetical protein